MSRAAKKPRDRRIDQARIKHFAGPTRIVRFEQGAPGPSQEAEAFLIGAAPVLSELLARAWDSDGLDHHALFVSDNSHDKGFGAVEAGLDPGHGSVRWLRLTTAFNVAAFYSSEAEARALLAPAPSRSVRMVVFVGGRVGVKVFEQGELRRALADAKRMAMHLVVEQPSEALFESLVDRDPQRLLRMLSDAQMEPTLLTFAAEIAGRIPGRETVTALLRLTSHEKSYVREGAVLGLALHSDDRNAVEALERLLADPSFGVRLAAREQLEAIRGQS